MNNNGDNPPSSGDALIDEQQIHHQQQLAQQQQQAEQQIQHQLPPQQEEVHDHANKRPRDEYLGEGHEINELANAVHQQAHEEYSHPLGETEESLLKKAKLDAEAEGSMVMAVMEEHYKAENSHLTSNIKNHIFEGVPSLTPEWLLRKVWLKVNGEMESSVLASLISKDMGPKLRQEIRTYLEKNGEVQNGCRINLKATIMQAIDVMISHQKDKPMLLVVRDTKIKPRKDGKADKNFAVCLTPYGQSVCINELQLKKRDLTASTGSLRTSTGTPTKGISALNMAALTGSTTPTASEPSIAASSSPVPASPSQLAASEHAKLSQMNSADLATHIMLLKAELDRKDLQVQEYRAIILGLKPDYPLPPLIPDNVIIDHQPHPTAEEHPNDSAQHDMLLSLAAQNNGQIPRYLPQ